MSYPTIELPSRAGADPDSLEDDPRLSLSERASRAQASDVLRTTKEAHEDYLKGKKPSRDDDRAEYRAGWALSGQTRAENDYNGYFDWSEEDGLPLKRQSLEGTKIGLKSPDTGETDLWGRVDYNRVRELVQAEALKDHAKYKAEQARLAARPALRRALGRAASKLHLPKRLH